MPVFNAEAYIADAINSVLKQSWQNWELIIINDGSLDNSAKIIDKIKDNRIIYIEQKNLGVSVARNFGLKYANGKYLLLFDADDILPENSLYDRVKYFSNNPEVDIVDGRVDIMNENMEFRKEILSPKFNGEVFKRLIRNTESCFFGPSWIIKLKDNMPKFKEYISHAEDLQFYLD